MALTKIDDRGLTTPIDLLDNEKIRFGTGTDLELYHDSSHSYIDNVATGDLFIRSTQTNGDVNIVCSASNGGFIVKSTTPETIINAVANGAVELYYDNSKKIETTAAGITVSNSAAAAADVHVFAAASQSADLRLTCGAGDAWNEYWKLSADPTANNFIIRSRTAASTYQDQLVIAPNGSIELAHGGSKKLETTSTGAKVTGALQTTGNVDVNGGSINLGVIDTSSGHINAAELMTFNIDTDNDDTNRYFAFYNNGAGGSGTELFRIQENGNASMGGIAPVPTDPAYNKALLHIHQTQCGTYGSELHLTNNTTGSTATDGMFLSMWTDNDVYFTNQEAGDINFTTNGHQALQIQSNKNVKITDGNLIIDTAGHGIDFSASSNQSGVSTGGEVLSDFEAGLYTPELLAHNGSAWVSATLDAGTVYGSYVKIGNMVHVQIYASNFHVNSSHDGQLAGVTLPISPDSGNTGYAALTTVHANCFANGGQTNFFTAAGAARALTIQEHSTSYNTWSGSATRYLMCGGTYRAD